jgi:hypothetical protein
MIRFKSIGVIGLIRVLRFTRNFRIIRAGLREAARVSAQVLWASGLQRESCFRTSSRNVLLIVLLAAKTLK